MKNPRIGLSLDKPCTQSWSDMRADDRGRFCDSCQKSVIDFTHMTDNEMLEFIRKNGGGFCGKFRASQLNRPFVETKLSGKSSRLNSILAGLTIAGATGSLAAQTTTPPYTPTVVIDEKHPTGAVCIRQETTTTDTSDLVLHVTVMDTTDHSPVAFVLVYVPGTSISVETDTAGKATVIIPHKNLTDSTITVKTSGVGYIAKETVINTQNRNQQLTINYASYDFELLGGPMIMQIEDPQPDKKKKK